MNLGFIGAGNMAGALVTGTVKGAVLPAEQVHVYDINAEKTREMQARLGVTPACDCEKMIKDCDMVVLAVKPNVAGKVLAQYRRALSGKALISIAAGWTSEMLAKALDPTTRILRVMPNTPALCGVGMTAFSLAHTLTEDEKSFAESMFRSLGLLEWVHEYQMEAVIGVSGSGPAYAYLFIEALADAGVLLGLTRAQSLEMAAQTLKGSAEMVLTTGRHPGALKDDVCSPGGTTIVAVRTLEEKGLRAAVIGAAVAAAEKAEGMGKA
ncbi:MAG: pyrroline-5-carboxylate reductase [Clostridia bacterium]